MRSRDLALALLFVALAFLIVACVGGALAAEPPKVAPEAELQVCARYVSLVKTDADARQLEIARLQAEVDRLRALVPTK